MDVRHEALLMLDKRGTILETAREISKILKAHQLRGAVIGGVAVVLHGHIRTTKDVDLFVADLQATSDALVAAGYRYDAKRREFDRDGVPVQLVSSDLVDPTPTRSVKIEEITTVSLVDLINIKLQSGLSSIVRAQDIADVIGLIRHHRLTGAFAPRIDKRFRSDFKKLLRAIASH
jgi:hypothetical protein